MILRLFKVTVWNIYIEYWYSIQKVSGLIPIFATSIKDWDNSEKFDIQSRQRGKMLF